MRDYFEFGETVDVMKLPPETAKAILGQPVYDVMTELFTPDHRSCWRVAAINRTTQTITLQWEWR